MKQGTQKTKFGKKSAMQILTTNGHTVEVDDVDRSLAQDFRWGAYATGKMRYAILVSAREPGMKKIPMHRMIMGAKPGEIVDHIDGNGLNNRRANLRVCSVAENNRNKSARWGRYGHKGVWQNTRGTWAAIFKGKRIGKYATEREAALAYDRAAEKEFGEFANLNYPGVSEIPVMLPMRKKWKYRSSKIWGREVPFVPKRPRGRPRNFSRTADGQLALL